MKVTGDSASMRAPSGQDLGKYKIEREWASPSFIAKGDSGPAAEKKLYFSSQADKSYACPDCTGADLPSRWEIAR